MNLGMGTADMNTSSIGCGKSLSTVVAWIIPDGPVIRHNVVERRCLFQKLFVADAASEVLGSIAGDDQLCHLLLGQSVK